MFLHNIPHFSDQETLLMYSSASHQISPFPCHFPIRIIHLLHRPQSTMQKTPCPLSQLSHPRNQSLKLPNICRLFGCRLVGHCIAYEWAIHKTNTGLLLAKRFRNAGKPSSKRQQSPLETSANPSQNATKPSSKRHQTPLKTPSKSSP